VLKNKSQTASQGGYWLEARRLERQEAKKGRKGFASSFPASQPSIFGHKNALTIAAQRWMAVLGAACQHPVKALNQACG
jgi:hypothetical protein